MLGNTGLNARRLWMVFAVAAAIALVASAAWAQTGTTSLHGTVSDSTGAVIVGAKVSLANP